MNSPYRRRKPQLLLNLWIYRRLVALAMAMGLTLWFIVINNAKVTIYFPFGLGEITSTSGLILLLGALAGSIVTALAMTLILTVRRLRAAREQDPGAKPGRIDEIDDRPPPDYAAKTTEGFSDAPWSAR
jgi:uncharacterized integral membrane protein